jgi:hypothetical protein
MSRGVCETGHVPERKMYTMNPAFVTSGQLDLPSAAQIYPMPQVMMEAQIFQTTARSEDQVDSLPGLHGGRHGRSASTGNFPPISSELPYGRTNSFLFYSLMAELEQLRCLQTDSLDFHKMSAELEQLECENSGRFNFHQIRLALDKLKNEPNGSLNFSQIRSEIEQLHGELNNSFNFQQISSELEQLQCQESSALNFNNIISDLNRHSYR